MAGCCSALAASPDSRICNLSSIHPSIARSFNSDPSSFSVHVFLFAIYVLLCSLNVCFYRLFSGRNTSLINLIRTKLGCTFFQVIMKRGHMATLNMPQAQAQPHMFPGHVQQTQMWRSYFEYLLTLLIGQYQPLFVGLVINKKQQLHITWT